MELGSRFEAEDGEKLRFSGLIWSKILNVGINEL